MKRILVPTDFSEEANNALKVAVQLAGKVNGSVYLLNVIDTPESSDLNTQGSSAGGDLSQLFMVKLVERVRNELDELKSLYPDADIETEYVSGSIYEKINEIATKQNMDLIVMGSKGATGLDEVMIGSNTEKMVRVGQCPVLTVKVGLSELNLENMVYASNFKDENAKIVPYLKNIQGLLGSHLKLLFINTPNNFETSREARNRMNNFAKANGIQNYDVNVYNEIHEEDGILNFMQDNNLDLVAVSTHSRRGLAHLISGSIAEDIVNHARKAVLTFSLKYLN